MSVTRRIFGSFSDLGSSTATCKSSSMDASSSAVVARQESASAAWYLTPAQCPTSKSSLKMCECQSAKRAGASARSRIHLNEMCSVWIVKRVSLKNGRNTATHQTIARHSRCVASKVCLVFVSDRDLYPTGLVVLSGCSWNNKKFIRLLHALVSSVHFPLSFDNASTSCDIRFFEVRELHAAS